VGRGLAAVLVLAMLTLAGCSQESNLSTERQEQKGTSSVQARKQGSPSAAPTSRSGRVGDTSGVGPFLVTLNDAEARLSAEGDKDHHYAVADLTLENRTQDPLDASRAEYLLRDAEGYSFKKGSLPEQKPQPEGQVVPNGRASGEVAFDLGTDLVKGPLTLSVSVEERPDAPPALFEFEVQPAEQKPEPKPKVAEKDESEPKGASAERPRPSESDYQLIAAPSGSLTVEVPLDWEAETGSDSEGEGGPRSWSYYAGEDITASITTARSLDAWTYTGEPTPGTYMVASKTLAQNFTDDELVHSRLYAGKADKCNAGSYKDFDRPPYSGKIQSWYGCGVNDTTSLVVAAAPEDRECVVVMGMVLTGDADRAAAEHIMNSFEVDCGALPPPSPADASASATPGASASSSASASGSASASQSADANAQAASCGDFRTMSGEPSQWQAQQYYDFVATPEEKAILDPDGDGFACEDLEPGMDDPGGTDPGSADPASPNPDYNTPNPSTPASDGPSAPPTSGGPVNCDGVSGPIPTPPGDPHNLDGDGDGQACE